MLEGKRKLWAGIAGVVALAAVAGGAGIVVATGDDDDQPIPREALGACTEAALAEYPGGTVTETEVGDDGAAYGVEIRLANGGQVEVHLDENCNVTGGEADDDGAEDEQDGDDD